MRPKQKNRGFFSQRQNLSDTQYNELVKSLKTIDKEGSGSTSRVDIRVSDGYTPTSVSGLINAYYRRNKLENETARNTTDDKAKVLIRFANNGGTASWYAADLTRISAGGAIVAYDAKNPLVGITSSGMRIALDRAENNPALSSNTNETQATNADTYESTLNKNSGNLTGQETGDVTGALGTKTGTTGITTYLIIGAIVIIAIILFKKKK